MADRNKTTGSSKVENLHVTETMAEDWKMDRDIRKGLKKEAEQEEEKLRQQSDLPSLDDDPEQKEELFEDIVWQLKRKGVWEEDPIEGLSEKDKEALKLGRELQKKKKHRVRNLLVKGVSRLAVVILGVFVLSMSTEANRNKVLSVWNGLVNSELRIRINSAEDVVKTEIPEQEAYDEIENKLGITSIKFLYIPEEVQYDSYMVSDKENSATLFYLYNDVVISVEMYSPDSELNHKDSFEGKVIDTIQTTVDNFELEIREISNVNDKSLLVTEILYEGAYYSIFGKVPQEIFEDFVREIYF